MRTKTLAFAILWAVTACGSSPSGTGGELVSVTREAPGAKCPAGGQKIETGVDTNGNGKLDPNEVTSTSYVCDGTNGNNGSNGTDGQATLTKTTMLQAGNAHCAAGGVEIDTGVDANGNGTLDPSEITSTQYVCNGADGAGGTNGQTSLTKTTSLPANDPNCPTGGVEIDTGLDTNGNGTLDPSEVTSTQYVCNGVAPFLVKPIDPPASPAGAYTVDARGGSGTTGRGGAGGAFKEVFDYGTFGGHAKVFATGRADASFTFPAVATYLGDEPVSVSTNLTVADYPVGTEPTAIGEIHTHDGDRNLYRWNGTNDVRVTGLAIAAGATVMFAPNVAGAAEISLPDDIDNGGTITTVVQVGVPTSLRISAGSYSGETGSGIDLAGGNPQNGVPFGLTFTLTGSYDDQGSITTAGISGVTGGNGGSVYIRATLGVALAGTVTTAGGSGAAGPGGAGGSVVLQSVAGHVWNAGAIDASGGDGTTSGGGAGSIGLDAQPTGECLNSGDLSAAGGNVTDAACDPSAAPCTGGAGANITLDGAGGQVVSSGTLSARGGNGTTAGGGAGGGILLTSGYGKTPAGAYQSSGDILVSGNLVTRGGDGTVGGNAGPVRTITSDDRAARSEEIIFLGYTNLALNGGDGATNGGAGGAFTLDNGAPASSSGIVGPSGGAINYASVSTRGGAGGSGVGGMGGSITFATDLVFGFETNGEVALNYGDIDARGGDGQTLGGTGGLLSFAGNSRAENHASIKLGGGAALASGGKGGAAGAADLESGAGTVVNAGSIDTSGGAAMRSTATGGAGADLRLYGTMAATNSGTLSTVGGASNLNDGLGGAAGNVTIFAQTGGGSSNTGTITVSASSAATPGAHGQVFIGGQNVSTSYLP